MDMNTVQADVDAARHAATRVADVRQRTMRLKDATMQIVAEDEWAVYKEAKRYCEEAERLMVEAQEAYAEASSRWHSVVKATAHAREDVLAALAKRTAERAYRQATDDINVISPLVGEVKQNCKDACKHLR